MLSKISDFLSLSNQRLFWFVLFLSLLPVWLTHYPPMVDLPQHAAQINALRQVLQGNPVFTNVFEMNWFTPYLVGYLSVYVLALLLPITVAIKIVISVSVIAIPLLSGIFFREIGADERWKWLVIPSSISIAFYWGLLNYMVAIPLGLLFLIYTVRFNRNASLKNGFLIALYSVFLFICHILVLGYVSLLALAYLVGVNRRNSKALCLRCLPYTAPLPLIAVWLVSTYRSETQASESAVYFGYDLDKLFPILVQISGSDYLFPLILLVSVVVIFFPLLVRAKFSRKPERWLPLAIGGLVFLVLPSTAFGTSLLYERLGAFLAPLWLMAWDPPESKSAKWHWLVIVVICLWATNNMYRFSMFDHDTQNFDQIMSIMKPEKKVLSLIVKKRSPYFSYPVYDSYPSWYQATRNGIVDFNFAQYYPGMIRYKPNKTPKVSELDAWFVTRFRWRAYNGAAYDYFIVRADKDMGKELFKERRDAVRLRARSGWWWLYEKKEAR